jgi:hypothetical protein
MSAFAGKANIGQNQFGLRDENTPAAFNPATVMIEPTIKTSPADR